MAVTDQSEVFFTTGVIACLDFKSIERDGYDARMGGSGILV